MAGRGLTVAVLFVSFGTARAWAGARPSVFLGRLRRPPQIDGRIQPEEWRGAGIVTRLVQSRPSSGAAASERTLVRIGFHGPYVFVAFECRQLVPLRAVRSRRDDPARSDRVWVMFDTMSDGRTAYVFGLTAAGTQMDGRLFRDGQWDLSWNGVWAGAVHQTSTGWSAEFRIPTENLRWPAGTRSWGLGLRRYVAVRQEVDDWQPIPQGAGGLVSYFGRLRGVDRLPFRFHVEIRPYLSTTGLVHRGPDSTLRLGGDAVRAGVDVLLAPRPNWSAQVSVWPDFGQVEVDPTIVNLTNYEVYLPEKRPFFLEESDVFTTPLKVFYSRRIGALEVSGLDSGETVEAKPFGAPIWVAARASGWTKRWRLAALTALVGPAEATIRGPDGSLRVGKVSRVAFYSAGRALRSVGRQSSVGVLGASVIRQDGLDVHVLSLDLQVRDFKPYTALAQAVGSVSAEAQGWGGLVLFGRTEGTGWNWSLQTAALSPDLNLNATGFLSRNDAWELKGSVWYVLPRPTSIHRSWRFGLEAVYDANWDRLPIRRQLVFWANEQFRSTWFLEYSYTLRLPAYDDWTTSGGVALPVPRSHRFGLAVTTDTRRRVVDRLHGWAEYRETQGPSWGLENMLRLNLGRAVSAGTTAAYREIRGWQQFVEPGEGELPIFGVFDFRQIDADLRLQVSPLQGLAVQLYAQFVWAQADFDPDRYFLLRDSEHPEPLGDQQADWSLRSLRVNLRLRWELDLNTTFYLVYSHLAEWRTSDVGMSWTRFTGLWGHGGDDLVFVKLDRRVWL